MGIDLMSNQSGGRSGQTIDGRGQGGQRERLPFESGAQTKPESHGSLYATTGLPVPVRTPETPKPHPSPNPQEAGQKRPCGRLEHALAVPPATAGSRSPHSLSPGLRRRWDPELSHNSPTLGSTARSPCSSSAHMRNAQCASRG